MKYSDFPMLIRYTATNKTVVVNGPAEVKHGEKFTVLETNYHEPRREDREPRH